VIALALARQPGPTLSGSTPTPQPASQPTPGPVAGAPAPAPAPNSPAGGPAGGVAPAPRTNPRPQPQPNPSRAADPELPPDHPPITEAVGPQVTIQWLGHASFYLHSPGGAAAVCDPYEPTAVGLPAVETGAHLVTLSSSAPDHSYERGVRAFQGEQRRVLRGEGAQVKDLRVTPFPLGASTAYLFEAAGMRVLHLGDLRAPLTADQARRIGPVDIALVPAGGDGLTPKQAVEAAKLLQPRIVIPMAYAPPGGGGAAGLRPVDDFIAASPYAVTQKDQDVMLLSRAELPTGTEIFLLKPPRR
jgi:L-ascorbate metabolism protein UlaG (beta-lactamase superfamily)